MRWSDLDAYGHVNNVSMLRFFEEARVHAFWRTTEYTEASVAPPIDDSMAVLDGSTGDETMMVIARMSVEYLVSIPYVRRPLDIELWIGHLGGASLEVFYEVWSPKGDEPRTLFTRASTTLVLVDTASQRPRRMTEAERAAWVLYTDEPVVFSSRR
ncbi:acyl-CoA thioesterase [Subtercola vilae]|nr:thioesterase family protein [Subtercola vilae]